MSLTTKCVLIQINTKMFIPWTSLQCHHPIFQVSSSLPLKVFKWGLGPLFKFEFDTVYLGER